MITWAGGGTGGRLMLMELDGLDENAVLRKYTWGLDLAGQGGSLNSLEGAGGTLDNPAGRQGRVGGLLAVSDTNGTAGPQQGGDDLNYVYVYDATLDTASPRQGQASNVGQVIDLIAQDAASWMVARYDYDPCGNITAQSGAYAATNPFRSRTEYWDYETGLGCWGYRYYSPRLRRSLTRDPLGEEGGLCLYTFANNGPIGAWDALGLQGSQPTATQSSQPTSTQSCCRCCAEDPVYQNAMWKKPGDALGEFKYPSEKWARYFKIDIQMPFKPDCGGDCAFKWLEEPQYDPDPKNKSHGARSVLAQDSQVARDWNRRGPMPSPCQGDRSIVTFDAPSILLYAQVGRKVIGNSQTFRVK
jgi:RHS repeat-associated protein